jgi:hypothetical protein
MWPLNIKIQRSGSQACLLDSKSHSPPLILSVDTYHIDLIIIRITRSSRNFPCDITRNHPPKELHQHDLTLHTRPPPP